jgi:hypothetical protein
VEDVVIKGWVTVFESVVKTKGARGEVLMAVFTPESLNAMGW